MVRRGANLTLGKLASTGSQLATLRTRESSLTEKGKYRSADSYMIAAKQEYLRSGGHVSDHLKVIIKDAARAARRGIGPSRQCPGSPVAGLGPLADAPRTRAGEPASRDGLDGDAGELGQDRR